MTNISTATEKRNPSSVARIAQPQVPKTKQAEKLNKIDYSEIMKHWQLRTNIIDRIKKNDPAKPLRVIITPDMAMDILTLNDTGQNREINTFRITSYTEQMKQRKWKANNGDTIRISTGMKLLDGQHRLWAIAQSEVSCEYLIVTGLDEDVFSYCDIGYNRNAEDITSINNLKHHAKIIAQAVKLILLFKKKSIVKGTITDKDVYNFEVNDFEQNKAAMNRIVRDIDVAKLKWDKKTNKYFTIAQWVFIFYVLRTLPGNSDVNDKRAQAFMNDFAEGNDLKATNPIRVLRQYFETDFKNLPKSSKQKNRSNKASLTVKVKFVFQAWNHFVNEDKIHQISVDLHDPIILKPIHTKAA